MSINRKIIGGFGITLEHENGVVPIDFQSGKQLWSPSILDPKIYDFGGLSPILDRIFGTVRIFKNHGFSCKYVGIRTALLTDRDPNFKAKTLANKEVFKILRKTK